MSTNLYDLPQEEQDAIRYDLFRPEATSLRELAARYGNGNGFAVADLPATVLRSIAPLLPSLYRDAWH